MVPELWLTIQSLEMRHREDSKELEDLLKQAVQDRAGALLVVGGIYGPFGRQIAAFAAKHRMPVFAPSSDRVEKHFGLLAYEPDWVDMSRRAATYVDKILKGAKPEDLPVQRTQQFNLTVNLKTAKALGITIPPTILYQATRVIR